MRGAFITFEGGEGCGKTTLARMLAEALRAEGREVLLAREPGGTSVGERVRSILQENSADPPTARAELLLFLAARAQIVEQEFLPALERGTWVVCDRFSDSTFAYQGYGRGLDLGEIRALNSFATRGLKPDLTLLLEVPPETARARLAARQMATGSSPDRMERAGDEFHDRLRAGFAEMAAAEPERFRVIDSSGAPAEVFAAVRAAVREWAAKRSNGTEEV